MMRQVVLYPDLEDGGWVAEVPSLPGCISDGESRDDALTNVQDAIEAWVAGAEAVGIEIPPDHLGV
jgi:predicted RNase H-like HicB family nuclease